MRHRGILAVCDMLVAQSKLIGWKDRADRAKDRVLVMPGPSLSVPPSVREKGPFGLEVELSTEQTAACTSKVNAMCCTRSQPKPFGRKTSGSRTVGPVTHPSAQL